MRRTRFLQGAVALSLSASLLATSVQPVHAAAPVAIDQTRLSDALFGAAVRVKDPGVDYDKRVVLSAELLDWRAKNPNASADAVAAHVTGVEKVVTAGFSAADARRSTGEVLGKLIQLVYGAPGVEAGGTEMGKLLASIAVRDMAPDVVPLDVTRRLSGAQQLFSVDVSYGHAQTGLWTAVRNRAAIDATIAAAWKGEFGKPTTEQPNGLDPKWGFDDLKKIAKLKDLVDVDKLVAASKLGTKELMAEIGTQFTALRFKLNEANGKPTELGKTLEELLRKAGVPDRPNSGASEAEIAKAFELEKKRREVIDQVKGALDVVVSLVGMVDKNVAKYLTTFVAAAYQVATAVSTLITAASTLATSTAIGSTLGAYGAIAGAAVGIIMAAVQLFGGLLGGGPSVEEQLAKAVIDEIRAGFKQTNDNLKIVAERMDSRFDRIDAALNTIYKDMMKGFGVVVELLQHANAKLDTIHDQLLVLASRAQQFNQQLNQRLSEIAGEPFLSTAYTFVDYAAKKHTPIPSYNTGDGSYITAVDRFGFTGSTTARGPNFAYGGAGGDAPDVALGANGSAGAISYLAKRAAYYDMPISTPERPVANADLWAEAARAYTLVALQNPAFAKQEIGAGQVSANASVLIDEGKRILAEAQKFSAPNASGPATNPLFGKLLSENTRLTAELVNSFKDLERDPWVMDPNRPFNLFGPNGFDVDVNRMAVDPANPHSKLHGVPDQIGRCGDGWYQLPLPGFLNGRNLPRSVLFGMYVEPGRFKSAGACWLNPTLSAPQTSSHKSGTRKVCEQPPGGGRPICEIIDVYTNNRFATVEAEFEEFAEIPGRGRVLARRSKGAGHIALCTWKSDNGPSHAVPGSCAQLNPSPEANMAGRVFGQKAVLMTFPTLGNIEAGSVALERRGRYAELVAGKLERKELPKAQPLEDNLRLLRAYTDLGLPRAKFGDDTLHSLVYGENSLPAEPSVIAAAYLQASREMKPGEPWNSRSAQALRLVESDTGICAPGPGVQTEDLIANCVVQTAAQRKDRLAGRLELHFQQIRKNEVKQTLPMVEEALRNLELTGVHLRARG
ncbi:hypothetical protein NLX83_02820 [Allokutzneria sp. A3M-2-11 16]|uniref:hypothetical protein n=1 Tax=Allokutzneria sp. A3M-2-11 16 TaxID=2962043 RepID=UPI0020B7BB32|nr:hypothetical protein [Allokutzneria sp. A3M-2-11 16]MCP3798182.1 hypothetical protein [Allokutzneria sp. A3M-2-11 16]